MICSVTGCTSPVRYKGMCGKHYKCQWRHGDPNKTLVDREPKTQACCVEGCNRIERYPNTHMCQRHHLRWTRYGRTERIVGHAGFGCTNTAGYKVLTIDGERKYEHVYLAEKALGRPLSKGVVVHHMNQKRDDNYTPFNLIICPDQAYHLLLHKRMRQYDLLGHCLPEFM